MSVTLDLKLKKTNKIYHEGVSTCNYLFFCRSMKSDFAGGFASAGRSLGLEKYAGYLFLKMFS